ncbi:hypothetical protein [Brevibacillus brevis]|uniref:hypothetical protein n=1 Tax=Brevibacillus brevis TaxID=1393 RepID=UPI000D0F7AD0|nr:hypothetical protein [Brevibacillus brevis]PSJ66293.1 hypothetical protein C7J99_26515 [Brevibacillus brevis]RED21802.1 hypothetical protein DES34_11867 [Brevibacillus brevis]GEC92432.1 hypothetical protein BBR01nite_47630 [Brevibacillus brevis]VEF92665.1 Uncharacterised protein [Brevibacillus brevis]
MGDDVLSVRHWLFSLTGIQTENLSVPKDFKRPMWFVEEPFRILEPRRADAYREKGTMNFVLMAKDIEQLTRLSLAVRQDLADRSWILPLYGPDKKQVGYLRECRLTMSKPDNLDRSFELKYTVYIPYTTVVYDPLEVIHRRYDESLRKGGKPHVSQTGAK